VAAAVIANPPVELTDLSHVERALAASRDGAAGTVRATTLNLVVYAPTPEDVASTQRALERIGGSRPLRAIVASAGTGGPRASVSTSCWLGSGMQQVCSEQIFLTARADALRSAVLSLLVTDLPTFVWWQGPIPPGLEVLSDLAALATSTVVDSSISSLEGVGRVGRLHSWVTDLAWLRFEPWREAIASLFDPPAAAPALETVTAVSVQGPINEARLLRGWLCSRLDRAVELEHAERSHVERVCLQCGPAEYVVERPTRVQVGRAYGPGTTEHPIVLPILDASTLLGRALDIRAADTVFEAALAAALEGGV
jgi:glucose-6-phosphate dehydrogenase assembly protein OpcA